MVSILPSARTPWDIMGQQTGQALQQVLPGALEKGFERQRGMTALDRAQAEIAQANGDPYKIALAFARVGAQNPNLERSLGPLMQTAMQNAKVNRAFGEPGLPTGQPSVPGANIAMGGQPIPQGTGLPTQSTFATPSPFNIMTPQEMDLESKRYANAVQDPNGYQTRYAELQNQNNVATNLRETLEDFALKSGVGADELPRFMLVGSKFDPRNPTEWAQKTKREYAKVKSNDNKILNAFIPGLGNALIGQNREEALKNLGPTVRDQVSKGLEQETRKQLAENYVSPTEISTLIHPLTPQHEKALKSLPKGLFPPHKKADWSSVADVFKGKLPEHLTTPFVSYTEAKEKDPKALQVMQDNLANFFLKNVDTNTSLLGLRDKIWQEKNYDWQQIGPAIRQAMDNGLKLEDWQDTELGIIDSSPPIQSLPDIFKDSGLGRIIQMMRGNK